MRDVAGEGPNDGASEKFGDPSHCRSERATQHVGFARRREALSSGPFARTPLKRSRTLSKASCQNPDRGAVEPGPVAWTCCWLEAIRQHSSDGATRRAPNQGCWGCGWREWGNHRCRHEPRKSTQNHMKLGIWHCELHFSPSEAVIREVQRLPFELYPYLGPASNQITTSGTAQGTNKSAFWWKAKLGTGDLSGFSQGVLREGAPPFG